MKKSLKYNKWCLAVFSILVLFMLQACCECDDPTDPECENYDPCYEIEAPVASFGAGYLYTLVGSNEYSGFFPDTTFYLDGDTIPATCTFYSYTTDADSFYWKVGQDPRIFRGNQFYLEFGDQFNLQPINVELITLKQGECFDNGFVRDTISKILVPSTGYFTSPSYPYFNNKYYGLSTEFPNDSFEIEFRDDIAWIVNMPMGTNGNTNLYRRDFDEVYFKGQSNETIWFGSAKFQPDDRRKLIIRYKISYNLGVTAKWYTYEAYRI